MSLLPHCRCLRKLSLHSVCALIQLNHTKTACAHAALGSVRASVSACKYSLQFYTCTVARLWAPAARHHMDRLTGRVLPDSHDHQQRHSAALTHDVCCSSALLIIALGDDGERAQYAGAEAGMGLNEPLEPFLTHA